MTVLTRKLGPTLFLGSIIVCWGGIMIVRAFPVNSRSNRLGNGLYEELAAVGCYQVSSWDSGGCVLSGLCLPIVILVLAL